jgi:hypothetical protein
MEELLLGLFGGAVVILADKSRVFRGAAKKVIKSGYAISAAVTAGGSEAMEKLKDLAAESREEFEAARAARAETAVRQANG